MKPSSMGRRTDFKSPFELSPTWSPSWWRLACFGPAVQWVDEPLGSLTRLWAAAGGTADGAVAAAIGFGAYGILASILSDPATGPDTYVGYLVSTFQGSTETTFYVLAVYFGAVQIRRIRHALAAGLTADLAGIVAAVFICAVFICLIRSPCTKNEPRSVETRPELGRMNAPKRVHKTV